MPSRRPLLRSGHGGISIVNTKCQRGAVVRWPYTAGSDTNIHPRLPPRPATIGVLVARLHRPRALRGVLIDDGRTTFGRWDLDEGGLIARRQDGTWLTADIERGTVMRSRSFADEATMCKATYEDLVDDDPPVVPVTLTAEEEVASIGRRGCRKWTLEWRFLMQKGRSVPCCDR